MKVWNLSKRPKEEAQPILDRVRQLLFHELPTDDLTVIVIDDPKIRRTWEGRAYYGDMKPKGFPVDTEYNAVVRLNPRDSIFPTMERYGVTAPRFLYRCWKDALTHGLAHELAHIRSYMTDTSDDWTEVPIEYLSDRVVTRLRQEGLI